MTAITCWKLVAVDYDGLLRSAWSPRETVWTGPLLRAHEFDPSSRVAAAPGVHALRYGDIALPWDNDQLLALARCELPPGTHAVMSPWALRAERLLITGLRFVAVPDGCFASEVIERAEAYWRRHVDILRPVPHGGSLSYTSDGPRWDWYCPETGHNAILTPRRLRIWWQGGYVSLGLMDADHVPWTASDQDDRWPDGLLMAIQAGREPYRIVEAARVWRERLARLTVEHDWPDTLTRGWRDYLAGWELGVYTWPATPR